MRAAGLIRIHGATLLLLVLINTTDALAPADAPALAPRPGQLLDEPTDAHLVDGALRVSFTEAEPKTVLRRVRKSWKQHWGTIAQHSAYFTAVATRGGQHIWAGRTVVAALLVRFRLMAFTSEVGESLRPLIEPWLVTATYAVSWAYVSIDVALRACDEYALRGRTRRVLRTLLFFAVFHSIATMLLPAVLIHAAVHRSELFLQHACRRWASRVAAGAGAAADTLLSRLRLLPTIIGLSLIPLMPLFDAPIEHLMERLFAMAWRLPRTSEWHERVLGHRSSATLTDYEVATCRLDATTDTPFVPRQPPPHPPPLPPPTRREQPELQRASGHGDPAYEHEPPAAPPPTHAPAS